MKPRSRKIAEHSIHNPVTGTEHTARTYRVPELETYRVDFFTNGVMNGAASYWTDDKRNAIDTMERWTRTNSDFEIENAYNQACIDTAIDAVSE